MKPAWYLFILKILFIFRESGRERGREALIGCLLYTSRSGLNLQPRHVPWPRIEPVTFSFWKRHPTNYPHWLGQSLCLLFKKVNRTWEIPKTRKKKIALISPPNDTTVNIFPYFNFFVFYVSLFFKAIIIKLCYIFKVIFINDERSEGKTILCGDTCKIDSLPTLGFTYHP